MKNRDRDEQHARRRDAGDDDSTPDGQEIASLLYGGLRTDSEKIDEQADGE